jgi:hypothetical protein
MKLFHLAGALIAVSGGVVGFVGCSSDSGGGGGTTTDAGNADTGTTPTDSGGNADTSTGQDSGADTSTAADTGVPGVEVNLQYGNCAAFDPCAGDPKGKWAVTGGCVSETVFDPAKANCPGIVESNVVFKAKGTIDTNATNVDRKTSIFFSAKVNLPKVCVDSVPGASCPLVAFFLKSAQGGSFDNATCTSDGAGGCNCDISDTTVETTNDTYTQNGATITTGGGKTYEFCQKTTKLEYRETGQNATPAVLELTKQ